MPARFDGFSPKALAFFRNLAKNNDRDWFTAHKGQYETLVKQPMLALVEAINGELAGFAPDHVTEPKRAIYRIHRDTRFSHDKTPYKDHQAAMFGHCRLPKNYCAGLYFSVNHKEVEIAGGLYMPEPQQLAAVRAAVIERTAEWSALVSDRGIKRLLGPLQGSALARLPKGFDNIDPASPAAGFLRMKQYYFFTTLEPKVATTPALQREITKRFRVMMPVIEHLNRIILAAERSEEDDAIPRRPPPMF